MTSTPGDVLSNLLSKVLSSTVSTPAPTLSRLVDRLLRDRKPATLNQVHDYLCVAKTDLKSRGGLLVVWEVGLQLIADQACKEIAFSVIFLVMQRAEFSLKHHQSKPSPPAAAPPATSQSDGGAGSLSLEAQREEEEEAMHSKYKKLLLQTFDKISAMIKLSRASVAEVQFASHTLSVFFFRLPLVSTIVVDAMQGKMREKRTDGGFRPVPPEDIEKKALPVASTTSPSSSPAHGKSTRFASRLSASKRKPFGSYASGGGESPSSPVSKSPSLLSPPTKSSPIQSSSSEEAESTVTIRLDRMSFLGRSQRASSMDEETASSPKRHGDADAVVDMLGRGVEGLGVGAGKIVGGLEGASGLHKLNDGGLLAATATVAEDDAARTFILENPDLYLWNSSTSDDPAFTSMALAHVTEAGAHWKRWLTSKESFFLAFAEMFALHVARVCSEDGGSGAFIVPYTSTTPNTIAHNPLIQWKVVPGYELVLECFFPLLRSAIWWDSIARRTPGQGSGWVTSLQGYMRVKRTATAMLQSDRALLPLYVTASFECTNLNSLLSVDSGIEHLNLFFAVSAVPRKPTLGAYTAAPRGLSTTASLKGDSLPSSFDYDVFWKSFGAMMDSESFQVLLKCCSFLYNNLHLFYGKTRTRMVNDLLGNRVFFRLFLHWSPEVRTCFQHLVVYKVLKADRRYLPCFSDSQVMLLYGTNKSSKKKIPISPPRVAAAAKAAWGKKEDGVSSSSSGVTATTNDAPATPDEIAQLTRSAQRRLALFDRANVVDDEELWSDMAFSSKIDSFVRMCLSFRENDGGGVPRNLCAYVEPALEQYSLLLIRYYRGVTLASLDDIPDTLSHRMMLSEFSEN